MKRKISNLMRGICLTLLCAFSLIDCRVEDELRPDAHGSLLE